MTAARPFVQIAGTLPTKGSKEMQDSPTRNVTVEFRRETFNALKSRALSFRCSVADLIRAAVAADLERAGVAADVQSTRAAAKWEKAIRDMLDGGAVHSRTALASLIGVTAQTIRPALDALVASGAVVAFESTETGKGRPPMLYKLAPTNKAEPVEDPDVLADLFRSGAFDGSEIGGAE